MSGPPRPSWPRRAMKYRHRHAIEQASRRWRGGRRNDSARRRRKMLISTRASTTAESSRLSFVKSNFDRPSTFTWLSTSTYTSVSSMISSPVRKSTSASGAHKVISRRQRSHDGVGATPGAPRPCPTIVRHAAPPFSNFHRTRSEPPPFRPKTAQNLQKNHPPP